MKMTAEMQKTSKMKVTSKRRQYFLSVLSQLRQYSKVQLWSIKNQPTHPETVVVLDIVVDVVIVVADIVVFVVVFVNFVVLALLVVTHHILFSCGQ